MSASSSVNNNINNNNIDSSEPNFKRLLSTEDDTEKAMKFVWDDVMDDVMLGLCFEVHRDVKCGVLFLDETDEENEKKYEIVDEIGLDVFGQVPMKKQFECVCPNCQRNLAASRFAPHLEKCMGMGRNSSRIANRRIANSGKDAGSDDDDNDDDWTYSTDKKAGGGSKKKREKSSINSPRRSKSSKLKNGDIPSVSSNVSDGGGSFTNYETMSIEDRKALLMQMCGVISEHTKKMCTRSHRCPQHTDEQRKAVRIGLLGQQGALMDTTDDVPVDIDTYDESESHIFQESLARFWDPDNSSNTSPADSTSTNNSSSSTRKNKEKSGSGKKGRQGGSGKKSGSGTNKGKSVNSSHSSTGSSFGGGSSFDPV